MGKLEKVTDESGTVLVRSPYTSSWWDSVVWVPVNPETGLPQLSEEYFFEFLPDEGEFNDLHLKMEGETKESVYSFPVDKTVTAEDLPEALLDCALYIVYQHPEALPVPEKVEVEQSPGVEAFFGRFPPNRVNG